MKNMPASENQVGAVISVDYDGEDVTTYKAIVGHFNGREVVRIGSQRMQQDYTIVKSVLQFMYHTTAITECESIRIFEEQFSELFGEFDAI
jgi:hypothetical protein